MKSPLDFVFRGRSSVVRFPRQKLELSQEEHIIVSMDVEITVFGFLEQRSQHYLAKYSQFLYSGHHGPRVSVLTDEIP